VGLGVGQLVILTINRAASEIEWVRHLELVIFPAIKKHVLYSESVCDEVNATEKTNVISA